MIVLIDRGEEIVLKPSLNLLTRCQNCSQTRIILALISRRFL